MSIEVNCPKCPNKVYIRNGRHENGHFIGDEPTGKSVYHRDSCPSGNFKDTDILQSTDYDYLSSNFINIEYRGKFNSMVLQDEVLKYSLIFNTHFSNLLNCKKIFLIKYNNPTAIYKKRRFTNDFRKTDYMPYFVESKDGEELIWVKKPNHKESTQNKDLWNVRENLRNTLESDKPFLDYNKFYLLDRKPNTNDIIKSEYVYELIQSELTEYNTLNLIYELLANEMNFEVVNKLLDGKRKVFNPNLTSLEELQKILKLKQQIGEDGEKFVLNEEKKKLKEAGFDNYADKVELVSRKNAAAGYDILSFDEAGKPKYIEVKTSNFMYNYFYMSSNEWHKAELNGKKYYIYVVTLKPTPTIARVFRNPTSDESAFIKEVNSYKIRFN
ncbi:MAG: DUF3883 domain-containing protein [Ignavibacteria bacterium]